MAKEEKINGFLKWEVENDLQSLRNVNKIKNNLKRFDAVKKLVKEELGSLKQIAADSNKSGDGLGI